MLAITVSWLPLQAPCGAVAGGYRHAWMPWALGGEGGQGVGHTEGQPHTESKTPSSLPMSVIGGPGSCRWEGSRCQPGPALFLHRNTTSHKCRATWKRPLAFTSSCWCTSSTAQEPQGLPVALPLASVHLLQPAPHAPGLPVPW